MVEGNIGIDHIHLVVKSLEESVEFFNTLGLNFIKYSTHGGKNSLFESPEGIVFEVQQARLAENPGLSHIAFTVENLDEFCGTLEEKGFTVDGPLRNSETGRMLASIRDPHGFLWQFVQKE